MPMRNRLAIWKSSSRAALLSARLECEALLQLMRSSRELEGESGAVSGCVQVVVGWILVTHVS